MKTIFIVRNVLHLDSAWEDPARAQQRAVELDYNVVEVRMMEPGEKLPEPMFPPAPPWQGRPPGYDGSH